MAKQPVTLTAAAILAIADRPLKVFPVKAWGGAVYLRPLTAEESARYEHEVAVKVQGPGADTMTQLDALCELVRLTVCDEGGKQLFTADDLVALRQKDSAVLKTLIEATAEFNALSEAEIEDLAKK